MTEKINDQISAFIDDELSAEECSLLVRRFERDPGARAQALRYTLIGAALRNEPLEPGPSILRRRITMALTGTAPAPIRVSNRWASRLARPLLGVGIAATVAVVAVGTLRFLNATRPTSAGVAQTALSLPSPVPPAVTAPSYVVPQDRPDAPVIPPPIRLTNYMMHHSAYASGLSRTSVSSNVVGAAAEPQTVLIGAEEAR